VTHAPFSGVLAPALTPFDADLAPDATRFVAHCRWLLEDGCNGLAIFGTTSEANSLSLEERLSLLDSVVDAGIDPACLMPGTGATALSDAVRLTRAAVERGCGGVLLLPPFYYKAVDDDGLYRFVAEVIQRVGDPRLKIYLYHIPPIAVVGWSLQLIERLLEDFPDVVVGLKDSSGDWDNTRSILQRFPGFGVFCGTEIFLLDTLRAGGAGTITATANVNAAAIRRVYDNWQGEQAEELQAEITALRKVIQAYPAIPALKAIVARSRGDESWLTTRPPLEALDAETAGRLIEALQEQAFGLAAE
jgi:4-hydroxy-tetrahydrodipicolinate synthase